MAWGPSLLLFSSDLVLLLFSIARGSSVYSSGILCLTPRSYMPYTPWLPLIASLSKRAHLLDHCQGLRPLRKVALIVLGVSWTSMKKATKMHTVIWQHLIKQNQFLLLRIHLLEITVLICKDVCTRMFIMASIFVPKVGGRAKENAH